MTLRVDTSARTLSAFGETWPCTIGRSGAIPADAKREGDGATPLGHWPLRTLLLRPDRVALPATSLPWRWLRPDDGWSDDNVDPAYNRPVRHPHGHSAERLWRDDGLYNVIVTLGHNDTPPVAGAGSAIFLHCAAPDGKPTEGCVALPRAVLLGLVERLAPGDSIEIF
ncbi:hypothetical protein EUV02_14670 [Polymorphobacter arshaanensis]|uniref:L,D-TPase catalytic domain-containing protein n=1 Tax=Glacieibacterium arshaanense TaxID=2511025 RepID=A0A4Y9EJC7_9SPHN|nr:L,D-transpeptidase family protein [Polymorphobacter arshaanensis]TFU00298.1 hypothetical protein EUV02_14670 [Polymorphobacter arshaanensis]